MLETPDSDAMEKASDAAVERAELRIAVLQELTLIGMRLARKIEEVASTAAGADETSSKAKDPIEAFARISRAVRLTVTLEGKADDALHNLRAGIVKAREERHMIAHPKETSDDFLKRSNAQVDRVREIVTEIIDAEAPDRESFLALEAALDERLEEDVAYLDAGHEPLREVVEHLCADLCLHPDWSRWPEAFEPPSPYRRHPLNQFKQPRSTPFWFDDATPEERRRRLEEELAAAPPDPNTGL